MPPAVGTKYNGYQAYLRYKAVMEVVENNEDFTRELLTKTTGIEYPLTLHIVNTLIQEKVIKVCRFDISNGHRKSVYKEIKHA